MTIDDLIQSTLEDFEDIKDTHLESQTEETCSSPFAEVFKILEDSDFKSSFDSEAVIKKFEEILLLEDANVTGSEWHEPEGFEGELSEKVSEFLKKIEGLDEIDEVSLLQRALEILR